MSSAPSSPCTRPSSCPLSVRSGLMTRVGVVGATGAVCSVTLGLLAERGFENVRAFASSRSAGKHVRYGDRELLVEEATPENLSAGELDLCFFSVGTDASRELVPYAAADGTGDELAARIGSDREETEVQLAG